MRLRSLLALSSCVALFSACLAGDEPEAEAPPLAAAAQPLTQPVAPETEPNGASATATPITSLPAVNEGNIYPLADVDYYSFTAAAGDRLYAATMTAGSASGSFDTTLDLLAPDGVTVIETDLDDGVFGATASSIAGAVLPAAGIYYLRVTGAPQVRPYQLHTMLKSGVPFDEFEPNNNLINAQPLPAGRWINGALANTGTDNDYYTFPLNAGDTLFASLDLDPERDGDWAGQLIFGQVNGPAIGANDAGGVAGPDSEAFFYTVKSAGNYYLRVAAGVAGSFGTYQLAASVTPLPAQADCTTYTSAAVPKVIPAAGGKVTSTLAVPPNTPIGSMTVAITLDHTSMADVDVHLQSPAGNDNALFTDVGNATNTAMDLVLSESAAFAVNSSAVLNLGMVQPELSYRLHWFDGEEAGGTWTLNVEDDVNDVNGGNLTAWSITICPPPAPVGCPDGAYPVTVLDAGFEAGAAGFTHAGALDEWALGTPSGTVIASCAGGVNCWKTKLAGNYSLNASGDLLSPALDLTGLVAPIRVRWAQKYQMDNASADHAYVDIVPAAGASKRVWEFLDAAMTTPVGLAAAVLQESAGWGKVEANIDSFAGSSGVKVKYHFDSDNAGVYAGYAVDDVKVTACRVNSCGDGVLFGGELCDDGNAVGGDGCDPNCTPTACGNGVVTAGEACDDGNLQSGDGCDTNCTLTACGNGVVTAGEACDDGNLVDGDGCDSTCLLTGCGNGVKTGTEACDDGNLVDGDGCDSNCTLTACNNGVLTMGEACDDGNPVEGDGCDTNCTLTACGNGIATMGEACDDGNLVDGDGCDSSCTVTACGNGIATMGEACDDGNAVEGDGCDSNCTLTACGNGIATDGEACDDGNPFNGDGCDNNCTLTACGNGLKTGGEACDDGNQVDGDGCDGNCTASACGNAVKAPGEGCDDGNVTDGDGCDSNCTETGCGNGIVTAGEECDDGNTAAGDGCDPSCKKESMGTGGAGAGGGGATTGTTSGSGGDASGGGGSGTGGGTTTTGTTSSTTTGGGDAGSSGGCGCAVPGSPGPELPPWAPALGLGALLFARRRRGR
jgi:MYXO-CTERM domain-containing protein